MKRFFHGGIHPSGNKDLAGSGAPTPAPIPAEVIIPLRQHIGAPCRPLVRMGDSVLMGQKIGDGDGLCVPVHASVSGKVIAIEPRPFPAGGEIESIVIENDYLDTPAGEMVAHEDLSDLTEDQMIHIIREAGIVGMGGATFPTNVKADVEAGTVEVLIANACECEPYITADDALLCTYPDQVMRGLTALAKILKPNRTVLAVEDNKPEAIAAIRAQAAEDKSDIEILVLPTRYPQGAEKQLIKAATGREVPAGKLPKDVGCVVFNAATCASVYKAIYDGEPITRRIVSITGEGIREPKNYIVRIGTPFSMLVAAAGGLMQEDTRVIAGGPMMGTAQKTLDVPVTKGVNSILCMKAEQEQPAVACIRCGRCVAACPMNLMPLYLYQLSEEGEMEELKSFRLFDCIECGCCAYVCPSYLPLTDRFRKAKRVVKEGEKV